MDCLRQAAATAQSVFPEVAQNLRRIPWFINVQRNPRVFQVCGHLEKENDLIIAANFSQANPH